ncbi:ribosome-binding factor A, partial [Bacillus sp. WP8]|uniref:ribosome-binding factor A n=1 Tax=Bacillus sp. WP8 TaxID=756828 RepID=UPI0037C1672C
MLPTNLKHPTIPFFTLTHVQLSPHFQIPKLYISLLPDHNKTHQTLKPLPNPKPYIPSQIPNPITLPKTPQLHFQFHQSLH